MVRLVVIFGPAAVGKMTVGLELQRLTGLRLFHNHMSVDLALQFFKFGAPEFGRLVSAIRTHVFEAVAGSDLPGLIFTYVWSLNDLRDKAHIDRLVKIFTDQDAEVCYVELSASQEERLRRNETPLRLSAKVTKRDLEHSRALLLDHDANHRMNSDGDFFIQIGISRSTIPTWRPLRSRSRSLRHSTFHCRKTPNELKAKRDESVRNRLCIKIALTQPPYGGIGNSNARPQPLRHSFLGD